MGVMVYIAVTMLLISINGWMLQNAIVIKRKTVLVGFYCIAITIAIVGYYFGITAR